MSKNIVLIGYRGTGKTSVGKEISKMIGYPLISTDEEITKKVGMGIKEYVRKRGWQEFREVEKDIIKRIENATSSVIDCGGGVVERWENIERLKKKGVIFWLKASCGVIVERINASSERPSLTGKPVTEEISEVLSKRTPLYKKACDYEIDTDNQKISAVVGRILNIMKNVMKNES
jgi:shikimate kinase